MAEVTDEGRDWRSDRRADWAGNRAAAERALAHFARSRDDIVTTGELGSFGVGPGAIRHRVAVGRLHRIHRGVYVLGSGAVSRRGRWRAAVAACGPDALLSHRSAASLWGLVNDQRWLVDVTIPTGGRTRHGIVTHESRVLLADDRAERSSVAVTAIPRTLVDLAATVSADELERAVIEAARSRSLDVAAALARCRPGHRGAATLRGILGRNLTAEMATRSELERRFLGVCRRRGVPLPETNVRVEGFVVDALWRRERLIVELDGYAFHRLPGDQRRDAARNRALAVAGFELLRFGWEDVTRQAAATAQTVLLMLDRETARRKA